MTFLPIVERELRVAARKRSTFWLRVVAALVAVLFGGGFLVIGLVAAWGITESVLAAALFTIVETGALVVVIVAGAGEIASYGERLQEARLSFDAVTLGGVLGGAFIAFYAFLGFEDMVNVAEEVKDERRTIPLAIGLTLLVTTVLYLCVSVISVHALAVRDLAASPAPLVTIYESLSGAPGTLLTLIGTFAVINGALIQIIMASRVVYGMASQGWLPGKLKSVHAGTRTPLIATGLIGAVIMVLAFSVGLELLAETTTLFIFGVFALCNAALFRMKRRDRRAGEGKTEGETDAPVTEDDTKIIRVPIAVPALGAVFSALFFGLTLLDLIERVGG